MRQRTLFFIRLSQPVELNFSPTLDTRGRKTGQVTDKNKTRQSARFGKRPKRSGNPADFFNQLFSSTLQIQALNMEIEKTELYTPLTTCKKIESKQGFAFSPYRSGTRASISRVMASRSNRGENPHSSRAAEQSRELGQESAMACLMGSTS